MVAVSVCSATLSSRVPQWVFASLRMILNGRNRTARMSQSPRALAFTFVKIGMIMMQSCSASLPTPATLGQPPYVLTAWLTGPARLPLSSYSQVGSRTRPDDELSPLNSPSLMSQLASRFGFDSWMTKVRPYAPPLTAWGSALSGVPDRMLYGVYRLPFAALGASIVS